MLRTQGWFLNKQLYELLVSAIHVTGLTKIGATVRRICIGYLKLGSYSIWSDILLHVDLVIGRGIHFGLPASQPDHAYWLITVDITVKSGSVPFLYGDYAGWCRKVW